ncbi:helix-hairpin-helix domain-containing protein [bacterium]|nr:helix-hairpin-helix domain-containing protein [bacterium]MBR9814247.1 helix-hairpin-helix domain-containing protein [bacterium]
MFKTLITTIALFASAAAFAGPVNINTANAETLDAELNGVGPVTAERIVAYREANGPFANAEQIMQVKGIGERTLEKNAQDILVK